MTLAEIIAAVATNPALSKEIAVWVSGTTDGKELLTNFAKAEVEKAVKENTAEIYTNIDNDLFEVLGERKAHDQKTYDFLKKIATEHKELKAKETKLNESQKIKDLEAKIKKMEDGGEINDHWRKIHEEALATWEIEKKQLATQLTEKETEFLEAQIEADLQGGLASLKIKEGMPQEAVDALVAVQKAKIIKGAKIIEGKIVYHKEDGTPLLNKEYKPVTPKEIWAEKLGSLIDTTETPSGGGGAKPTIKGGKVEKTGEGDTATIKLVLDRSSFSTKLEFNKRASEALKKEGIEVGSKDYNTALNNAYTEYEVGKMDFK